MSAHRPVPTATVEVSTTVPALLVFTTSGRLVSRCEEYLDSTGLPKLEWPEGAAFF